MNLEKLVGFMKDTLKERDEKKRPFCTAVVPAAGSSTRMAGQDKQFCPLLGIPVLARPLRPPEMITRVIALAAKTDAAVGVVPVKDTIKMMGKDGAIDHTPDRSLLRAAQTPQVFDADLLRAAYAKAAELNIDYTDDCAAVEALGKVVYTCEGENTNIKITTPEDLILASAILEARNA